MIFRNFEHIAHNRFQIGFKKVIKRLFFQLDQKKFVKKIFVVTHPHRLQLTTKKNPIDVSDIVKTIVKDYEKVEHINFSKILKENKEFYSDFNTIFYDLWHI